jgi:dipeptidyl aminopeptidase/acylaminoacyl peptidase
MWLSGSGQSVEATPPAPTTVAASVPTILPSSTQPVATSPSRLSPATPRLPTLTTAPPTRTNLDISKEIIFVRRDASDNPTGQAWILDQTGSRSSKPQLFGTQLISNFGSWSVPREEILYDLQRSDTDRQIFRMGKDGRNSTPVSPQGWYAWNGVWAPNGKFAAFAAHPKDSPSAQIYVIEVENAANIQQVTNNSKYNQHPSWSADGQFLAFESDQSGSWNIWVVPVNDEVVGTVGAALQLTFGTDKQLYQRPFWSSDMSSITLTSLASDANQEGKRIGSIWRLPVVSHAETAAPAIKGGKLEQLTQGDDEEGMISPDGVRLIFTRWNASHNKRQLFAQNPSDKNTAKPLTDANYDCSTFIYVP